MYLLVSKLLCFSVCCMILWRSSVSNYTMTREKIVEKAEPIPLQLITDSSDKVSAKDMVSGKDERSYASASFASSLKDATSGIKGIVIDQTSGSEQGACYPPTSYYNYYHPEYNGTVAQSDDKGYLNRGGGSYKGIQSDNGSLLYYMPGYGPYTTRFVGVDGKHPYVSYGPDALPCYAYDSTYGGNSSTGSSANSGTIKSMRGSNGSGRSNAFNLTKGDNNISHKGSISGWNPKVQQPAFNFSKSSYPTPPVKPLNKLGSGFHATGFSSGFQTVGKYSSLPTGLMTNAPMNYLSTGRVWDNNSRYKSRGNFSKNGEFGASTELTRGPRAKNRNSSTQSSSEVEQPGFAILRDKYNLEEFRIQYDNAKFYVIKSYSEDDVHKCIKYNVWSSTPNGNKKLDAGFCDVNAKLGESGSKCPVFLFFSVNTSGQFLGVAEMIGPVDFNKNMDFWQLDKWNGFFPVKWHIIKDVPNGALNHIILENSDNRSVTYTRDTQEIGLKQGLEMLSIFKNYSEKSSILEDFNFYENREKLLVAKRNVKSASETDESQN